MGGLRLASVLAGSVVLLVLGFLVAESLDGLARVAPWRFVLDAGWHPTADPPELSLLPMVVATLVTTAGAVALAGPVGILAALFQRFHAPAAVARPFRSLVQLLAGIPSVVYGFWGLLTVVPLVRELAPPGPSLLAGILVLALMIVPTVTLLSIAALEQVPAGPLLGASSLGLSRLATLRAVVLPSARAGLRTAVLLGTLRAIGETMAVLMVCGNVTRMPTGLLDPARTLTANIALELGYATAEHRAVLFVSGLFLMLLVGGLVVAQERLARRSPHA